MALTFVLNTAPLYRLGELVDAKLDEAAERLAKGAEERAKELVPVRTGALQRSISAEQAGPMHWELKAGMPYAAIVEWGGASRPARPYMTPAMEEARAKLPEVMAEALNEAAKEAGRGV